MDIKRFPESQFGPLFKAGAAAGGQDSGGDQTARAGTSSDDDQVQFRRLFRRISPQRVMAIAKAFERYGARQPEPAVYPESFWFTGNPEETETWTWTWFWFWTSPPVSTGKTAYHRTAGLPPGDNNLSAAARLSATTIELGAIAGQRVDAGGLQVENPGR